MTNKRKVWMFLLGLMAIFSVYASNPASTTYVDEQIAILKAEILRMLNGG